MSRGQGHKTHETGLRSIRIPSFSLELLLYNAESQSYLHLAVWLRDENKSIKGGMLR
jgi:hypothetical protein